MVALESRSVYLRRRLLVLAGALSLIIFIVLVIVKPGSHGEVRSAIDVDVPGELIASESENAKQQEDTEGTGDIPECSAEEILVTPLTDRESYAAGEMPQLSMRIELSGATPCQAQLGTAGMRFEITSGSDQVWRSTDCQVDGDTRAVILEPATPLETEAIGWDRTRSSPETCAIARDQVTADGATYHLHVAVSGVSGNGTAPFLLY